MITEFSDEGRHAEVRNMLAHRRVPCVAARILIDRRRTRQVRVLEIGELAEQVAPVVIQCHHQRVIGLGQPVQQQPARVVVVDVGVPHRR